jgi:hypothetical protein
VDAEIINLHSATFSINEKIFNQKLNLDFDNINNNEYLTQLPIDTTPNFIIINSPNLKMIIDRETSLKSSLIMLTVHELSMQAGAVIDAVMSLEAKEISEKDYICGVMGASHVGFGYFGSGISYTNCLDDFFEKYFSLINESDNQYVTIGQPPFFFRINQYNDQDIYSDSGGIVVMKVEDNVIINGDIKASGVRGLYNNDIVLGSSSGGTIYIESTKISISGI